jgi:hypothetical protein
MYEKERILILLNFTPEETRFFSGDENLEVEIVKKKLKPFSIQSIPLEYIANVAEIENYSRLAYDDKEPSKVFSEKNLARIPSSG